MKLNIYVNKKFFKEYNFNNNCLLEEIIKELKKIGGNYYLFTTKFNRWLYLYEPNEKNIIDINKVKDINTPPLILTENIYIFCDNEILNYKYLYEKFLYNKIEYKIFYESLNNFLLGLKKLI